MEQSDNVQRTFGGPGTGKTTSLIGNVEEDIEGKFVADDYDFDEQMLVTYTNAGVDEAIDRINGVMGIPKNKIEDRVMTIHGFCFRALGLDYMRNIVKTSHEQKFCNIHDLEYGQDGDKGDIMTVDEEAEGNELLQISRWLQANRYSIEEYEKYPGSWDSELDTQKYLEKWKRFKRQHDLYDWPDVVRWAVWRNINELKKRGIGDDDADDVVSYLRSCDGDVDPSVLRGVECFTDTKALYVDEVQDLDKLQWLWYLCQKIVAENVSLVGDDDQCIYSWGGADPDQFLNEEGDLDVLDTTYRLPPEVWSACESVIEQVDERQDKDITPVDKDGEVDFLHAPSRQRVIEMVDDSDDVMFLFRTHYHINEFSQSLIEAGIPYTSMAGFQTWKQYVIKTRDALASLGDGELDASEANHLIGMADDAMVRSLSEFDGTVTADDFFTCFPYAPDTYDEFVAWFCESVQDETDELNWYQSQAIIFNIRKGKTGRDPADVRLGTIHSSKGREADTVVVATDTTQRIVSNMDGGRYNPDDAERRVMYVGLSRAERHLVVAQDLIDDEMSLDLNSLLGR